MSLKALSDYVCVSKYAHFNEKEGRRETWEESTKRMCDMHRKKYGSAVDGLIDDIEQAIIEKRILPSMRAMQFGSVDLIGRGQDQKIYNCSFSYCDRVEFFGECMMNLLCGSGTGFSVKREDIAKLPGIYKPRKETATFTIPDTIEGWADAVQICVEQYFEPDHPRIVFDFSQIRPKGAKISSGVGRAPGPAGLQTALMRINGVFMACLSRGQDRLRPIDAYDVVMHASDAVLSGGVRRSASICLFSPDDEEMLNAKTGNWFNENPQRARSNNSAILVRGQDEEKFWGLTEAVKQFGEPGFLWVDDITHGTNPCQPSFATVITPDGLRTFADIEEGSVIWSREGWTTVKKKWSTGVKPVYRFKTTAGEFVGTENHRVVQCGEKIEAKDAEGIDRIAGPIADNSDLSPIDIVDGLLIGDGTYHLAGGGVFLVVGEGDHEYADSEIGHLICQKGYGGDEKLFRVESTISKSELPKTYERRVPDRFKFGSSQKVRGFLRGLYTANGTFLKKANRVTLKTSSPDIRDDVQKMLSSIGINSYFTTNKPAKFMFCNGEYESRESYDVNITGDRKRFMSLIGFIQSRKQDALEGSSSLTTRGKKTFDIFEREPIGEHEVFDITVDNDSHTYWTGGLDVSNCVEIGLRGYDEEGNSGWQFCNLSTINMAKVTTQEKFYDACFLAAAVGTLQAGYTEFDYLGPVSERITRREALIGVSMTGMAECEMTKNPQILGIGASTVKRANKHVARLIGINPAARTTCVKPEGTASAVLQTSSGIHPHHHRRAIRRVQANATEPVIAHFAKGNPDAVESSVWGTEDLIAEFPYEVADGALIKSDTDALQLLDRVVMTKRAWVDAGRNKDLCVDPRLSHNVSNTINVHPAEWDDVFDFIHNMREHLSGVSLLSASGDLDYPQAPFVAVWTEEEIRAEYGDTMTDFAKTAIDTIETSHPPANLLHECVMRLELLRRYEELQAKWQDVDYREMREDDDSGIKLSGTVACAGGKCDLI